MWAENKEKKYFPSCSFNSEVEGKNVFLCAHCDRNVKIKNQRHNAKKQQQKQADQMLIKSTQRFEPAAVGTTVMVPVPDVTKVYHVLLLIGRVVVK